MNDASGLIISARTSAAARISSPQSAPANRRSPVREPARVASVSNQPDPDRRIVTSADSASAGGGTLPATRRTSLFTSSSAGHSAGAFHEIAIGNSSAAGADVALGVTKGPGRVGAGVPLEGASPALTTTRASKAGSRPITWRQLIPIRTCT